MPEENALQLLEAEAKAGDWLSQCILGCKYSSPFDTAFYYQHLHEKAADSGFSVAQFRVFYDDYHALKINLREFPTGTPEEIETKLKAREKAEKAAEVAREHRYRMLEQSARQGYLPAQAEL